METRVIRGKRCYLHHTSYFRGYVSRREENPEEPGALGWYGEYKGHFGEGFAEYTPNWQSSWYSYVTYWITME